MGKKEEDDDTKEVEMSLEEEKEEEKSDDDAIPIGKLVKVPNKRKRNEIEHDPATDNKTATASENETATENALNKGPWTQEEDKLLVAYVKQHGEGNWNTVQKHSGLSRCGKSCRLRWLNHLRPDLKKGAFTEEEEQLVIELHASYGSKWARMALQLPGRTDNEIKNFWNTRVKRRRRQNLPVYPDRVLEKVMNAAAQSGQNTDLFGVNQRQEDYSEADRFENPVPYFKFLPPPKQNQSYYESLRSRIPSFTDDFMKQILSLLQPNTSKMSHWEQELVTGGYSMNVQSPPVCNYSFVESNPEQFTYCSPLEPLIHETEMLDLPPDPSFNHHEVPNDWGVQQSNLMPVLQSDNTFVQVPFTDPTPSSLYDGTLESIIYGSAGVRQESYTTDSGSQYSQFGYKELEPASANTTGEVSLPPLPLSVGEELTSFDEDWIRELCQHIDDDSLDYYKT